KRHGKRLLTPSLAPVPFFLGLQETSNLERRMAPVAAPGRPEQAPFGVRDSRFTYSPKSVAIPQGHTHKNLFWFRAGLAGAELLLAAGRQPGGQRRQGGKALGPLVLEQVEVGLVGQPAVVQRVRAAPPLHRT